MVVPNWWLVLTAVYVGLAILVLLVCIVMMIVITKKLKEVMTKVNDIASKVQSTVTTVHDRSEAVLGAAEESSGDIKRKIAMVGAGLTGVFAAIRIAKFMLKVFRS
jgi:uncharacterized protein YoxC